MSLPQQNALGPFAVRITTRTFGDSLQNTASLLMEIDMDGVMAFSFSGRFKVTTAVLSSSANWTFGSISKPGSTIDLFSIRPDYGAFILQGSSLQACVAQLP